MIRGLMSSAASSTNPPAVDPYWSSVKLLLRGDSDFSDASPIGRTLTVGGSPYISTSVKRMGAGSLLFDGSTASLSAGSSSDFNFGTGDFTIEAWVLKLSGTNNFQSFFSTGATAWGAGAMSLIAFGAGSGVATFQQGRIGFGSNIGSLELLTSVVPNNEWNHVALRRSSNTFALYLNGTLQQSLTYSGAIDWNANGNTVVGRNLWDGAHGFFHGHLDDLRVTVGVAREIIVPTQPYPEREP